VLAQACRPASACRFGPTFGATRLCTLDCSSSCGVSSPREVTLLPRPCLLPILQRPPWSCGLGHGQARSEECLRWVPGHGGKGNACVLIRLLCLFQLCFPGYTFPSLHSYMLLFKASALLVTASSTRSRFVRVVWLWGLQGSIPDRIVYVMFFLGRYEC